MSEAAAARSSATPCAHAVQFVLGQRALRLDGGKQHLLDGACGLAGGDEAHGRADAAEIVRAPVRERERVGRAAIAEPRHGRFDFIDAGIKLGGETRSHGGEAFGKKITRHNCPPTRTSLRDAGTVHVER